MFKLPAPLFCSLFSLLLVLIASVAMAQTAPTTTPSQSTQAAAPPPEKLAELLKLLDDPEIRSWIQSRPAATGIANVEKEATLEVEDIEAEAEFSLLVPISCKVLISLVL